MYFGALFGELFLMRARWQMMSDIVLCMKCNEFSSLFSVCSTTKEIDNKSTNKIVENERFEQHKITGKNLS